MDQFFDSVQKRRMVNGLLAVTVLLAVFLGVKSLTAIREYSYIGRGIYPSNVISISGKGEVLVVPDIASFSFSVIEEGKTVKEAQDKATKKINDLVAAIKSMGVEEKDIQTTSYNSYPKYEYTNYSCVSGYCPPGRQILTGYEVSQSISIKVRNTDNAGAILTKVGDLGASNISGLNFVVDDMEKVQTEARDKAIADAKDKAKVLSKSLGVKLKRVVNFYESGNQLIPLMYGMGGAMADSKVALEAQAVPPQVPMGENTVYSYITITYEVE